MTERELFVESMKIDQIFRLIVNIRGLSLEEALLPDGSGGFKYIDARIAWSAWQASANREGYKLLSAEQLRQWVYMANCAEQYGCPECFEARGCAHALSNEINGHFNISKADSEIK